MSLIVYRNISEADIAECARLFFEIFGPQGCGESWTLDTSLKHIKENVINKNYCFIAVAGERIVGLILAYPVTREADRDIFVDTLGVHSSFQGQHIGSELLNKVREKAIVIDAGYIRLLANPKFLSFDWYHHIGMKPSGWVELEMPPKI